MIRVSEDLRWELEVPAKNKEKKGGKISSSQVLENLVKNVSAIKPIFHICKICFIFIFVWQGIVENSIKNLVTFLQMDKASVCQGVPKSLVPNIHKKLDQGCVYDNSRTQLIARENGDYLRAEDCDCLLFAEQLQQESENTKIFSKACEACVCVAETIIAEEKETEGDGEGDGDNQANQHSGKAQITGKKSFETETLQIISRLNIELSDKKHQLVKLWEEYQTAREEQRLTQQQLQALQQEQDVAQNPVVVMEKDWMKEQLMQRDNVEEFMKKKNESLVEEDNVDQGEQGGRYVKVMRIG